MKFEEGIFDDDDLILHFFYLICSSESTVSEDDLEDIFQVHQCIHPRVCVRVTSEV